MILSDEKKDSIRFMYNFALNFMDDNEIKECTHSLLDMIHESAFGC